MQRVLSTVVLLGLLLATAAAFALTEHLKLIKSPIYATHVTGVFSPVCKCATDKATIGFKLRRADSLTVSIVDSAGHEVYTLATDRPEKEGAVTFRWGGRTAAGTAVPDATYQPQIKFENGRTIVMPNKILVDTVPPKVLSATDGDGLLIAGGTIAIQYSFDGRARAAVFLGAHRVIYSRHKQSQGGVRWNGWNGKRDGTRLPPGRYVLEVAARDLAGNETPLAERKRVVVRIEEIALGQTPIHVVAGARFAVSVQTSANSYNWALAGKHGSGTTKLLHLRAPTRLGRYRLRVSAHGHSTSATVIVGKK